MSRAIGWAAVMSVVTASIAGAQSTDQTLDRAVAAWGKVKTARATFEQTVTNSLTGSNATALPLDITGEFLTDPRGRYDITSAGVGTVAGHPAKALLLSPKAQTQAPFTKATIWVDDDDALIRQFEVVEPSGVTRRIRITSLDLNVPVDKRTFSFTPPAGVRVVER